MSGRRELLGLISAAAIFVFGSATTFSTMGIVLFAMLRDLGWSETVAGGAFTTLILTCCVAHLLPVPLMARIGARWTIVSGGLVLAVGFIVAYATQSFVTFYVAAGILGIGFSLVANTPGIYLITGWFGARAPRMIGLYMMIGTLGNAIGPPMAQALVSSAGGWRLYWLAMTATALALSTACAIVIREPAPIAKDTAATEAVAAENWTYRETLVSPQFIVIALAMVATQICMITVAGVTPSHFARLGLPNGFAAQILGLQGLVGTLATAISGRLSERFDPKGLLVFGLISTALALSALAFASRGWTAYAFVPLYGVGWSVTCLAVTVLLVRYFGQKTGVAGLAAIFMLAGAAAVGPAVAGAVADVTGSFTPALGGLALLLPPIALAAFVMPPARRIAPRFVRSLQTE
ncbi:MAG TPA: MFS transporter [Alphaproteobacteria bacterium]|nr:MFS transporter [Alphaproteobacteria bacterium]